MEWGRESGGPDIPSDRFRVDDCLQMQSDCHSSVNSVLSVVKSDSKR